MKSTLELPEASTIALFYRPELAQAQTLAKTLCQWLKERGHKVLTAPGQKKIPGSHLMKTARGFSQVDLAVVLGGDGTYLRAVRWIGEQRVPILGVNLGSLGFLTTTRAEELFAHMEQTLDGKMELAPRSMISIEWWRNGKKKDQYLALNDVVLERGSMSQLINVNITADRKNVSDIKADGIIIASPTGSTAYNLAAGGPILHPEVSALVVTPIAPHSLTSRPLIFPDNKKISFKISEKKLKSKKASAHLVVDGYKVGDLTAQDELLVKKTAQDHCMVQTPGQNYFHLLREKLKFGDRA
ncbi:MAG: NAD(+)/NADH kinase [Proteobacteria bacterium]|jgi:NAD+ kinase|nr:NAD(+)/NADH kinase [Pseudomonadota bacterium]